MMDSQTPVSGERAIVRQQPKFRAITTDRQVQHNAVGGVGPDDHHDEHHGISVHTEHGTWKAFYSNGSGDEQEIALGAIGTVFISGGAAAAPAFGTVASSDFDSITTGAATQQIPHWDDFDGVGVIADLPRYATVNGSTNTFVEDATTGRNYFLTDTSTTVGQSSGIRLAGTNGRMRAAENWSFKALIFQTIAPIGGTFDYMVGFLEDVDASQSDGIYFRSTSTGNWLLVARNAATETTVDMGVAPSATTVLLEFRITGNGASIQGYINGTLTGAAITTNIPANILIPAMVTDARAATVTTAGKFGCYGWGWKGDIVA